MENDFFNSEDEIREVFFGTSNFIECVSLILMTSINSQKEEQWGEEPLMI